MDREYRLPRVFSFCCPPSFTPRVVSRQIKAELAFFRLYLYAPDAYPLSFYSQKS